MNYLKIGFDRLVEYLYLLKNQHLDWQTANQAQQLELRHQRALAQKSLETELAKKSAQLSHEIALLKTQHNADLTMLKTRCNQDIKDYRHYLDSLDQLKKTIQSSYSHLPDAISLTIHHHAKSLLNRMWEAETLEEKIRLEAQLLKFMTTVHEEAREIKTGAPARQLPENTLKLINHDQSGATAH